MWQIHEPLLLGEPAPLKVGEGFCLHLWVKIFTGEAKQPNFHLYALACALSQIIL